MSNFVQKRVDTQQTEDEQLKNGNNKRNFNEFQSSNKEPSALACDFTSERKRRKQMVPHQFTDITKQHLHQPKTESASSQLLQIKAGGVNGNHKLSFKDLKMKNKVENVQNSNQSNIINQPEFRRKESSRIDLSEQIIETTSASIDNQMNEEQKSKEAILGEEEQLLFTLNKGNNNQVKNIANNTNNKSQVMLQNQFKSSLNLSTQSNQEMQKESSKDGQIKKGKVGGGVINDLQELDKQFLAKGKENKVQKAILQKQINYMIVQEIPKDLSLKHSIELECDWKEQYQQSKPFLPAKLSRYFKYFIYSLNDLNSTSLNKGVNKEFQQQQNMIPRLQWMKSVRDVYKKYINSCTANSNSSNSNNQEYEEKEMPFFYIRNNNFIVLFSYDSKGEPYAILNASQNLTIALKECNQKGQIQYSVENICHEEEEEEKQSKTNQKGRDEEESSDEEIKLDDIINNLETPLNIQTEKEQFFKFVPKNQTQLYIFEKKNVNALYNVILNYVGNQIENFSSYQGSNANSMYQSSQVLSSLQILAPHPFLNCTYKECELSYCGSVAFKHKNDNSNKTLQKKYQMKYTGLFFPHALKQMCQYLRLQQKEQVQNKGDELNNLKDDGGRVGKDVEINLKTDNQSKLFSYKKCLQKIKLETKDVNNFKILFN